MYREFPRLCVTSLLTDRVPGSLLRIVLAKAQRVKHHGRPAHLAGGRDTDHISFAMGNNPCFPFAPEASSSVLNSGRVKREPFLLLSAIAVSLFQQAHSM